MDDSRAASLAQIRELVRANSVVQFAAQRREEVYEWVERTRVRHDYAQPDFRSSRAFSAFERENSFCFQQRYSGNTPGEDLASFLKLRSLACCC